MSAVNSLDPSDIQIGDRIRRTLNREVVDRLKESIARIGLKTPISVQYRGDEEGFFLVAGRHRLQACIELGWTDIPVLEEGSSSLDARMWEIAENLHRADLTALEHDEHVAEWIKLENEREAISVQLAPKIAKDGSSRGRPDSGINAAARELGIESTQAKCAVKVASLSDAAKEAARETGLDNNRSALLAAAKAPDPEASIRGKAAEKDASKVIDFDKKKTHAAEAHAIDKQVNALSRAWDADALSLRAALAQVLRNYEGVSVDEVGPVDEVVAETIQDVVRTIKRGMGIGLDNDDPDVMPVLAVLGGRDYLSALNDWDLAYNAWRKNRSRKKGPSPEPPPVPVR